MDHDAGDLVNKSVRPGLTPTDRYQSIKTAAAYATDRYKIADIDLDDLLLRCVQVRKKNAAEFGVAPTHKTMLESAKSTWVPFVSSESGPRHDFVEHVAQHLLTTQSIFKA